MSPLEILVCVVSIVNLFCLFTNKVSVKRWVGIQSLCVFIALCESTYTLETYNVDLSFFEYLHIGAE